MTQAAKNFADRLNHCLDETDAPIQIRERAVILSRMLEIPKHQAWSILEGHQLPDQTIVKKIANEFEVDPEWLTGTK